MICHIESPHELGSICPFCAADLHYTYFEKYTETTPLDKRFWGKILLHSTYALLIFQKGRTTQRILHIIKYKNQPELATYLGTQIGKNIKNHTNFNSIQALIPIPIHAKKRAQRGYNQSELLASGIAEILSIPVYKQILYRKKTKSSQTKLNKQSRWNNLENQFGGRAWLLKRKLKHVALVDDVITTGATIERCVLVLREILPEDCKISVLSLATTR